MNKKEEIVVGEQGGLLQYIPTNTINYSGEITQEMIDKISKDLSEIWRGKD